MKKDKYSFYVLGMSPQEEAAWHRVRYGLWWLRAARRIKSLVSFYWVEWVMLAIVALIILLGRFA